MRVSIFILATALIGIASCKNPAPPVPLPSAVDVPPGEYKVCDAGKIAIHGTSIGPHVEKDDVVEIKGVDTEGTAEVCLRGKCAEAASDPKVRRIWTTVNGPRLQTVDSFPHTQGTETVQEPHLVKIEKANVASDPDLKDSCKKEHVFRLVFCPLKDDGSGEWQCQTTTPHQGGAHIEN